MDKKQLIAVFGGTEAELARRLGMSSQRVNLWGDTLKPREIDGVLAALMRHAASRRTPPPRPDWIPEFIWEDIQNGV